MLILHITRIDPTSRTVEDIEDLAVFVKHHCNEIVNNERAFAVGGNLEVLSYSGVAAVAVYPNVSIAEFSIDKRFPAITFVYCFFYLDKIICKIKSGTENKILIISLYT